MTPFDIRNLHSPNNKNHAKANNVIVLNNGIRIRMVSYSNRGSEG